MKHRLAVAAAVLALSPAADAQDLRIGFMATQTGGSAIIGQHAINGWKLGLEHEGWTKDGDKIAGVPLRMFYADDQFRPDVAVKEVERLISAERIHLAAGFMWTNILLAVRKPLIDSGKIILSTVAGPSVMAGKECTPYFVSTSWTGEQTAQAAGDLLNGDGVSSLYVMVPNYQGGKDIVAGVTSTYKGKVIGQTLFKMGETDFQAEISKLRAEKPQAVFYFGPGAMGIAFMKQWSASGAGKDIKLYTHFLIDGITLPVVGEEAIGSFQVSSYPMDSAAETNQKFVKDYVAKYGHIPSLFASQAYDGPRLIAAALAKTGGKFDDPIALVKAMRRTPYPSTRGYFPYNVNGLPIIDFYKTEIARGADGKAHMVTRGTIVKGSKDPYWQECPEQNRH